MRELSSYFITELQKGKLAPLLDKVKKDSDLDLQIREGYINIYFKGNNLLKLKEDLSFEIDKKFTDCKEDISFSTEDSCRDFITNKLPQIKEKIIDVKSIKNTLEIEYEQLLIRANNYTNSVNSEYLIVDRQYARAGEQRKNQMDLFGVFVDRGRRGSQSLLTVPFVAEVKYSLNPDISNLPEQINRYYKHIESAYKGFIAQAELLLHQKAELGLFDLSNGLVDKLKSSKVDEGIKNLRIIIVLVDYNPYSTKFGPDVISQLKNLPYSDQIYLFKTGFAIWHKNLTEV